MVAIFPHYIKVIKPRWVNAQYWFVHKLWCWAHKHRDSCKFLAFELPAIHWETGCGSRIGINAKADPAISLLAVTIFMTSLIFTFYGSSPSCFDPWQLKRGSACRWWIQYSFHLWQGKRFLTCLHININFGAIYSVESFSTYKTINHFAGGNVGGLFSNPPRFP